MATTSQHLNARNDNDLRERFSAAAEQAGIPNAYTWVGENIGKLIAQEVEEGQTVADVHAYADETRNAHIAATPERPGLNLSAVTDSQLATAIAALGQVS